MLVVLQQGRQYSQKSVLEKVYDEFELSHGGSSNNFALKTLNLSWVAATGSLGPGNGYSESSEGWLIFSC